MTAARGASAPSEPEWGDSLGDGMDDAFLADTIRRMEDELVRIEGQELRCRRILTDLRRAQRARNAPQVTAAKGESGP